MDGSASPVSQAGPAGDTAAGGAYRDGLVFAAACAGMFAFAVMSNCVAAMLPSVIEQFRMDRVEAGALLTLQTFGILLGSLVFGPVVDRYGYRGLLFLCAALMLAGIEWLAMASSLGSLRGAVVLVGFGGGVINGAASALVSDISTEGRGARLSVLGIFYGIGAMGAPAVVGVLLDRYGYGPVVAGLGAVGVPFLALTATIRFPVPKRSDGISAREAMQLLREPALLLLGLMLLIQSGLETTMGGWTAPFYQEQYGIPTDRALLYITLFWSGLMLARFLHGTALHAIPAVLAIPFSLATAIGGGLVMTLAPHVAVAAVGTFVVGLGCGGVFPLVLSLVGDRYPAASGTAFGIAFTLALVGGMLLPFVTGVLGSAFGMRTALVLVPAGLAFSVGLFAVLRRGGRRAAALAALAFLLLASACAPSAAPRPGPAPSALPAPEREFRGEWVASVANIDWPSRPGLPADSQRAELIALLDRARALNLNAVILQVRPAGDALYPSELEPWSEYLTGAQGRPPEPLYDPLAFAVAEAHRRGLELHAWFNPFRARHPSAKTPEAPLHLSRTHPDLVHRYGAHLWMDPGEPAVREHSIRVMLDVVRRYDVDGVHIDDYFYPYPERDSAGRRIEFPDSASFARYRAAGGRLARDDWRRQNVDRFVEDLYRAVRREKGWVKVGVSPFGIWRPGYPAGIQGFDAYAEIYADSRKWLREGWLDYLSPQLYWPIAQVPQSYPVLLRWWVQENVKQRHLWPGNFTSKVAEPTGRWPASEIVEQVLVTRGAPGATGNVHFSERVFRLDPDSLVERLERGVYAQPALVPATPWLRAPRPARPRLTAVLRGDSTTVAIAPGDGREVWLWYVRSRTGAAWTRTVVPGGAGAVTIPGAPEEVFVTGVGRTGALGPEASVRVRR